MADVHITKQAAAQRQIDAAIRILFAEEDPLAVHTVVAAAHTILIDLAHKSEKQTALDDAYSHALKQLHEYLPHKTIGLDLRKFKTLFQRVRRQPANFLKHADRDAAETLNLATLETDHLLLEACARYRDLGFEPTTEMYAFCKWHLAAYPHEEEDRIETAVGAVDSLDRTAKLQFGAFLLDRYLENAQD
ncbi:MAG: hypothetical protein HY017_21170 [Betaproteobacteria bacterium]|nr:hypothetical protein [Betaproteobacteria bacterium]